MAKRCPVKYTVEVHGGWHPFDGSTCLMAPFWWFRALMSERPEAWAAFDDIIQLFNPKDGDFVHGGLHLEQGS